jgi:hypothetical protein
MEHGWIEYPSASDWFFIANAKYRSLLQQHLIGLLAAGMIEYIFELSTSLTLF